MLEGDILRNGLIILPDSDTDTDLDSDSILDGYIVLYINFPLHGLGLRFQSESESLIATVAILGHISVPGSLSESGNVNMPINTDSDSCTMQNMFTLHRLGTWIPTPYFCIGQESESEWTLIRSIQSSWSMLSSLQIVVVVLVSGRSRWRRRRRY